MKKIFNKDNAPIIISVLYILSIFLDLHSFYSIISTLIRVIFISINFLIIFVKYSSKKEKKYFISYFSLLFLYIFFHILNIRYNNLYYEILYFIKMSMNVLIIYSVYKLSLNKRIFYNTILISSLLISLNIIICNLFKCGYTSYDFNIISYNIVEWFTHANLDFRLTSTKGLFHLSNQISGMLILYLPLLIIKLKNKINFINIFSTIMLILALFMLGTRVSTYTPFIVLFISLVGYILTNVLNTKINYKFICIIVILGLFSCFLYSHCPLKNRIEFYESKKVNEKVFNDSKKNNNKEYLVQSDDLLIHKLKNKEVPEEFYLNYYPLKNDRAFYENYILITGDTLNDTRQLEREIIKRVKYLNNNKLDDYLGIGYNRIMNIFNIENDFIMQYYSLGIIGTLLTLGVYVFILLYLYLKTLFNLRKYFNFENGILLFSETYFFVCAFFTGNILNSISLIIPISFVLGYHLTLINKKEKIDYEYVLGFKTTLLDKDSIINKIINSKNQNIIFNINPLILMNFYKDKKIINEFNEQHFNIPDGNGIVLTSRLSSGSIKKSIPGIEMFESICEAAKRKKYTIYLYGAKEESVSKTKEVIEKKYKDINIVGYKNGYVDSSEVVRDIVKKKPNILFVALGSPLQEDFIIKNKKKFKSIRIIMPVGGTFDVVSGNLSRAPIIYRRLKIEWLYRMIKEPRRFKQILILFKYVFIALFGNVCYNNNEAKEKKDNGK